MVIEKKGAWNASKGSMAIKLRSIDAANGILDTVIISAALLAASAFNGCFAFVWRQMGVRWGEETDGEEEPMPWKQRKLGSSC